jgi:hypothetical protein
MVFDAQRIRLWFPGRSSLDRVRSGFFQGVHKRPYGILPFIPETSHSPSEAVSGETIVVVFLDFALTEFFEIIDDMFSAVIGTAPEVR